MHTSIFVLLTSVLVVAGAGCRSTGVTDGSSTGPPEDLGIPVTAEGAVYERSPLAWSASGDELYFVGSTGETLEAVRVADGRVRIVDPGPARTWVIGVSADGRWVYRNDWTAGFYRVPVGGGSGELIADSVLGFAISPVGDRVAYGTKGPPGDPHDATVGRLDTLYLLDLAQGKKVRLGFGMPLAFSPDGTRLAYDRAPCDISGLYTNGCDTYVMDLATGGESLIPWARDDIGKQVWWDAGGLKGFAGTHHYDSPTSPLQWVFRNATRGTVEVAYAMSYGVEVPAGDGETHAPNGQVAGGWILYLDGYEGLRLIDLATMRNRLVVVDRSAEPYSPAISWDARRVAYLIGTRIYVHDLPTGF